MNPVVFIDANGPIYAAGEKLGPICLIGLDVPKTGPECAPFLLSETCPVL